MKSILFFSLLAGAAATALAQPAASAIANVSSRGLVGAGAGSLIVSFVVEGSTPKQLLVRGVGPGLADFGVDAPASAVAINVYDSSGAIVAGGAGLPGDPTSDAVAQEAAQLGAFPLHNSGDSEILATLPPGAYSVEIAPNAADAPDGDALLEIYDADAPGSGSTIVNLSTRGEVGASAGTVTAGFVVDGNSPKNLLIRGVGADLNSFGVGNAAPAVGLAVYDAAGNLVAANNGYQNDPGAAATMQTAAAVGAFPLGDAGDSALLVNLAPGAYTVEIAPGAADADDAIGLLEVYDVDSAMTPPAQ